MSKNKINEELLRCALQHDAADISALNRAVMDKILRPGVGRFAAAPDDSRTPGLFSRLWRRLTLLAPAPVLAPCLFLAFSVTAYAAIRLLTAPEAARKISFEAMAQAFEDEDALSIQETQQSRGFDITLLGIAYGSSLREYLGESSIPADSAYALVALSRSDGSPMPAPTSRTGENQVPDLFMTFLAPGYSPDDDNPLNQTTGMIRMYQDGVYYQTVECTALYDYGRDGFYLSVNEGIHCEQSAYRYDEATGRIALNEDYDSIHALFEISLSEALLEKFSAHPAGPSPYDRDLTRLSEPGAITGPDEAAAAPAGGAAPSSSRWTAGQLRALSDLSLPDEILYITSDRILTARRDDAQKTLLLQSYDYDGTLLAERAFSALNINGFLSAPRCTAYGFALTAGTGYEVYDYDFRLLYSFDMADIPAGYQAVTSQYSAQRNGEESNVSVSVPYDPDGRFSSNLQYFYCNIYVEDEGLSVPEGWLYDGASGQWSLIFHNSLPYEELVNLHFYTAIPSNDGRTLMFSAGYYESETAMQPGYSKASCGYGLFSAETGEILSLKNGSPASMTGADNRFLADLDLPAREPRYAVILDGSAQAETVVSLDCESQWYYSRISPDGRFVVSCDEYPEERAWYYRVYDLEKNTVSDPLVITPDNDRRPVLRCYPGGFRIFCSEYTDSGSFLRETSLGFYSYEP